MLAACQPDAAAIEPGPTEAVPAVAATGPEISPVPSPPLPAGRQPTASAADQPGPIAHPEGGTAVLGLVGRPDSLNPLLDNNPALRELAPLLFDSLLQADPVTARLKAGLATSWEYTTNGRQLLFHLPPDLRWNDGTRLTAGQLAESLLATRHPSLLAFSDVTARDEETLVLTFAAIDCAAVTNLALLPLLPADEVTGRIPRGSGPFKIVDWSENRRTLTLVRNPYYAGSRPALDGFTVRFIGEDEVEVALSEGHFDAFGPLPAPPSHPAPLLTDLAYPAPQVFYVAINFAPHNEAPLAPEVRQALIQGLDHQAVLDEVLAGDGQLLPGPYLPGHWAAQALSGPGYSPAEARRLLGRAGLKDTDGDGWLELAGQRLELGLRANGGQPLEQRLAWFISSYYRDLGLFIRAEGVPWDILMDDFFTHDFSLALHKWPLLPDPDQRLFWRSTENVEGEGLNFTSYKQPQLDQLLDRGVAVPGCQPETRAKIYRQVQTILAEDRPVDFLLAPNWHLLTAGRLRGLEPGPFAPFTWNARDWYVAENQDSN